MKSYASLAMSAAMMFPVAAGAADLTAPPAPRPPPPFSWNGFYIGGDVGGAWSNLTVSDSRFGLSASANRSGFIGGGEVGFNYQASNIVFGIEGNFDWASLPGAWNGINQGSAKTDWVTSVAGRLGVAADRMLFYVKGGGGWVGDNATITNLRTGASVSASSTNSGWLLGGGIEWAFAQNWSGKIEYDYLGLRSWSWSPGLFLDTFTVSRNIQMLKAGINYRFDWGSPLVARY
jgi:outer membrane immunogenic protein